MPLGLPSLPTSFSVLGLLLPEDSTHSFYYTVPQSRPSLQASPWPGQTTSLSPGKALSCPWAA